MNRNPVNRRLGVSGALAIGASALILLAGCAAPAAEETAAPTDSSNGADLEAAQAVVDQYQTAPDKINQTVPLSGKLASKGTIIFIQSELPATGLIAGGAEEAVKAIGWNYESVAYENANPATLKAAFLTALSKEPDAVIVAGSNPTTYGDDILTAYKNAGVPIIVGSVCPLDAVEPLVAGGVGCEAEDAAGRALANWFIADSKGEGKAVFENVTAIPSLAAYVKAFTEEVTDKCPDCTVQTLEVTLAQVGAGEVVPTVVNTLRSNPDLTYAFFDNAQFSKGIVAALQAAGLGDTITVGGRSMDEGAQGALKDKTEAAWTAFAYNVAGYSNVDAALRVLTKSDGGENTSVLPFQLVTQKTVEGTTVPYRYPADALDQYLELWGK